MARRRKNRRKSLHIRRRAEPGAPPGHLTPVPDSPRPCISAIRLGADCRELKEVQASELPSLLEPGKVLWVDVDGLGDANVVGEIGKLFNLHPLALEDVVNVHQRAKVENYESHTFIVIRMIAAGHAHASAEQGVHTEQVSIFLGDGFVITFQEHPGGDCLEPLRRRLRRVSEANRSITADFLTHAIIDAIVDGFFPVLEHLGERIEDIEDRAAVAAGPGVIHEVHAAKADLLVLRRAIWPLREALNMLVRDNLRFISLEIRPYFRDCHDHAVQLMELIETYRELVADSRDLYLSGVSNRLNEIMKVLTVISTIFIPLNFVAGVYGMNFNTEKSPFNMPELNLKYGYPAALALMAAIAGGLLYYFRVLGWIGGHTPQKENHVKEG